MVPSKNLYICFCYISLYLPKIGQNLISAGHWDMGAQLGVPYGHMGCRQFGVQFGYLDVYDLPFCVPYDVVLLLDISVVLFCVPDDVVLLLDVPMDLCTQLYSSVQCTLYST